jgi:MscS family membrane protein
MPIAPLLLPLAIASVLALSPAAAEAPPPQSPPAPGAADAPPLPTSIDGTRPRYATLIDIDRAWSDPAALRRLVAPPLPKERPSPLAVADISSPQATLRSLVEGVDRGYAYAVNAVLSYVRSGRLWFSTDERQWIGDAYAEVRIAAQTLDFSGEPSELLSETRNIRRAVALKEILDRIELPPWSEIPDAAAAKAAERSIWRIPGTGIAIGRIEHGDDAGEWRFTASTVAQTPQLADRAVEMPYRDLASEGFLFELDHGFSGLMSILPLRWLHGLPHWTRTLLIAQPLWRWGGLLLVSLVVIGAVLATHRLSGAIRRRRERMPMLSVLSRPATPILLCALLAAVQVVISGILRFTEPVYGPLMIMVGVLFFLALIWLVWALEESLAQLLLFLRASPETSLPGQLTRLVARFAAIVATLVVVVGGADRVGLPAYSVVAGVGVGGLAIALAARSTLANFLGSLTIMIERPFRIGETIKSGVVSGKVEAVDFRSTRIRTNDDTSVTIPSGVLADAMIENTSRRGLRHEMFTLSLTYGAAPAQIRAFVAGVRSLLSGHPMVSSDRVYAGLAEFADSSLDVAVSFYMTAPDRASEVLVREEILLRLIELAAQVGVEFAFPTRTVVIDGGLGMPPTSPGPEPPPSA